ncbi:MAG: proline--tRNA ligase [Deinococcota bacterium]
MRMTQLFFASLREVPADADTVSHQLLLRAGMVRQLAAGIFDYMPLGYRVKKKVEDIFREEMDAIDGQEVTLPVVHPAEVWQRSGRWDKIGSDMARFQDRHERDMCLAMTHEEAMADLASQVVRSYKQLPFMLYQIQTKFRDERRPRGGLIRVREFTMKDGYSFHADEASIDAYYPRMYQAYFNIFRRCGLTNFVPVMSDNGIMGGDMSHEFMALVDIGEDTLLICEASGYSANRQVARFQKPMPEAEEALALEEIATPNTTTIESLAEFLDIPKSKTAKAVFVVADVGTVSEPDEKFVFVVIRGDMDLSETKLTNALKARRLRPATPEEIRAIGAEPGYGSPVGIQREDVTLVADDLIPNAPNLVAGANKEGYHYKNVNYGRDYTADVVTDIAAAQDGDPCPLSGEPMKSVRGIEVGNIFKLGTAFSEGLGAFFLDENGKKKPIVMGSYGIGPGRLMASVLENSHDDNGIVWPISIAPYHVSLLALAASKNPNVAEAAERIYNELCSAGVEVLYDDRDERPGVKFNDADLIGLPVRITIGKKGLDAGTVEVKVRSEVENHDVPLGRVVEHVQGLLEAQWKAIKATVVEEVLED